MAPRSPALRPRADRDRSPLTTLSTTAPLRAREVLLAALACLLLAAWPLRGGLFAGGDAVAMAVDTGTVVAPWRAVVEAERPADAAPRPRNPELSDQGVVFYPFHRWVARSWLAGDPPLWCPLIYCGAPALGNPQAGVLDPQVAALAVAEAIGGRRAFHATIDLLAWARLALAGLGAYLLARRLGLGASGASLAAVGFGLSGYLVLWLNHSLGHVTPLLPWVLLGVEGTRGPRPVRAALGAALALLLAIAGGHPETAFYVGAAAGLWALAVLREERRAGLLAFAGLALGSLAAAPILLPFVEYLGRSGAQEIRAASAARGSIEFGPVAAVALLVAGVLVARRGLVGAAPRVGRLAAGLVAVVLGALLLRGFGLPPTALLTLLPDRFGRPGDGAGGWVGPGSYTEEASSWLPAVVTLLACGALFAPAGPLRRRGLVLALGFGALALVLRVPGLLELKRTLPVVGLGATVRLAAVSALALSLLAGSALEGAPARARRAGLVLAALLAAIVGWPAEAPPLASDVARGPESDAALTIVVAPEARLERTGTWLEGWLAADVPVDRVQIVATPVGPDGTPLGPPFEVPTELMPEPSSTALARAPGAVAAAPAGARWFRSNYLQVNRLALGHWSFDVALYAGGAPEPVALRRASVSAVVRPFASAPASLVLLGLAALLIALELPRRARAALPVLAAVHGLWFARGVNPVVPAAELFPPTATERLVLEAQGEHRFFGDPAVLVPDTGLVRGLRALDGYDGMDPAEYNTFRTFAMRPGLNALLGWNARGVDLDTPAWKLLGVKHLVLGAPLEHPDWQLVASPRPAAPAFAETFVYRARDPFPRAFVATRTIAPDDFEAAAGADWDPRTTAIYEGEHVLADPARSASARIVRATNNVVEVEVELDGDGLLVLTDQLFPGWVCTVDGEVRPIERADAIFRGVGLVAGDRRVRFEYRPRGLTLGLGLTALAAAGALALALYGRSAARRTSPAMPFGAKCGSPR